MLDQVMWLVLPRAMRLKMENSLTNTEKKYTKKESCQNFIGAEVACLIVE